MAYEHGVTLDFSRPGKPTDNAYVESFNGRLREECLNANWFLGLKDAYGKIEAWRRDYNESRPHTASGHVPPAEFAFTCTVDLSRATTFACPLSFIFGLRSRGCGVFGWVCSRVVPTKWGEPL